MRHGRRAIRIAMSIAVFRVVVVRWIVVIIRMLDPIPGLDHVFPPTVRWDGGHCKKHGVPGPGPVHQAEHTARGRNCDVWIHDVGSVVPDCYRTAESGGQAPWVAGRTLALDRRAQNHPRTFLRGWGTTLTATALA